MAWRNIESKKKNELSIGGKTYYLSVHNAGEQGVILGLENTAGELASALFGKSELIANLRDLAIQIEGWQKEEKDNA